MVMVNLMGYNPTATVDINLAVGLAVGIKIVANEVIGPSFKDGEKCLWTVTTAVLGAEGSHLCGDNGGCLCGEENPCLFPSPVCQSSPPDVCVLPLGIVLELTIVIKKIIKH